MTDGQTTREVAGQVLMPNYGTRDVALVRGEGTRVWDANGREYLDLLAGISVNNLGHCHPAVVAALREQAGQFMHCSNLYLVPQQVELARRLTELCFADRCFFANSGAEVNEGAIKLARLYSKKTQPLARLLALKAPVGQRQPSRPATPPPRHSH